MDIPICVIDASTFVDRIHKVKSLVYNGQLRLVIPSSTLTAIDQLYQKSVEPSVVVKEAPKSKTFGKMPKKEYPAFDTNPRITKTFLERVKAGHEQETGHLGRPVYEEEECHWALHFAGTMEQYTPWKDIEAYEEVPEAPKDGKESWADKLRRKQNEKNGDPDEKAIKGPSKPKLVAKTGTDNSPWKVQKNAPSISATDVPSTFRNLMSCALWRMHESIHRNDENQIFVLTDQVTTKEIAEKLNITVLTVDGFARKIEDRRKSSNLSAFGDLEKDFGIRPVRDRPQPRVTRRSTPAQVTGEAMVIQEYQASQIPRNFAPSGLGVKDTEGTEENPAQSTTVDNMEVQGLVITPSTIRESYKSTMGANGTIGDSPLTDKDSNHAQVSKNMESSPSERNAAEPAVALKDTLSKSSDSIWSRSFADALTGQISRKIKTLVHVEGSNHRESIAEQEQRSKNGRSAIITGPIEVDVSPVIEDSDEEVVVFKPKGQSTHRKAAPVESRPTTPKIQRDASDSKGGPTHNNQASNTQTTPKTASHAVRKPSKQLPVRAKPGQSPLPVIDPDAFGRDFAVNTNASPRGSIRGTRSQHSPRPSVRNAAYEPHRPASRPSSSHRQSRADTPTAAVKKSPALVPSVLIATAKQTDSPSNMSVPSFRTSPVVQNGTPGPSLELRAQMINAPIFQPAGTGLQTQATSPVPEGMAETISLKPQAPIGSGRPSPKADQHINGFAKDTSASRTEKSPRRSPAPHDRSVSPVPKPLSPKRDMTSHQAEEFGHARVHNSEEYADQPRQTSPVHPARNKQNQDIRLAGGYQHEDRADSGHRKANTRVQKVNGDALRVLAEPDKAGLLKGQEVKYVLKSGATREQARGKGKLWIG